MQENWTFKCTPLCNEKELKEILANSQKELDTFISYYFKKEGAVAEKVKIKGGIDFINNTEGTLVLDFDLIFFNACLNIHEKERDTMKINFIIDQSKKELNLKGEYWPEREIDDI